ncbi:E3 ubiquitin-protein ligase RNF34-like [Lytechinus pictus]|uniref:E3 ubiquitin-protein ligase RNF34-like n=1 Tax=Lytechinus pictus TaxID=7653 RepID=UPI0030B9C16F
MGSGAGKPVVSPSATPAYTFCYSGAGGPSTGVSPREAGDSVGVGVQAGSSSTYPSGDNITSRPSSQQSIYGEPVDENCNMVCEACSTSFHIFKKKYRCTDCDKYYCSNCFIKEPRKCCSACSAIQQSPTRAELMTLKIKDLRLYLNTHSVSTQSCREKDDLVDLVMQYVQAHPQPTVRGNAGRATRSSASTSSNNRTSTARQPGNRASHPQAQQQQQEQQPQGQRVTQRFEEIFNDIFSRLSDQGTGSSVDPPNFNFFTNTSTGSPGEGMTNNTFNSTSNSGNDQRPQSRTAWTSGNSAASNTATTPPQESMPSQQHEEATSTQNTEQTPVQPLRKRASLSDVETVEGIDSLSIKQLKEILTANFVNYKGCVERYELQDRVKRLYEEKQHRKRKEDKKDSRIAKEGEEVPMDDEEESTLCKICMDAEIDCVLLECGHMVTCTNCGKRMNECPICRQYVVRAVHIFKA